MKIIRTSKISIKFINTDKKEKYKTFIKECRYVLSQYIDYLWFNKIEYVVNDSIKFFDIQKEEYNIPSMLSNVLIEKNMHISSFLSARVKKCILTQALGILKASCEKQRKRKFIIDTKENISRSLLKNYNNNFLIKPNVKEINIELNSLCAEFIEDDRHFNGWIKLKSLGNKISILIPIQFHKHMLKFINNGFTLMTSFLLSDKFVDFRYEKEVSKKVDGHIIGADQGLKTVLTLSNGETTPNESSHRHTLESILKKLSRKKKGSCAFRKAQQHRENFINWSINNLNFNNIKQINFEKIVNINFKKHTSRLLSHWCNTEIRDKLISKAELSGVHIQFQSSPYRSQRCSSCGLVLKKNRKGKIYTCGLCGHKLDADLNAAKNHEQILYNINYHLTAYLSRCKTNIKGFFWKEHGIFDLCGQEITVPDNPIQTIKC